MNFNIHFFVVDNLTFTPSIPSSIQATPVKSPRPPLLEANHQIIPQPPTVTYASIKFHHPPLKDLQESPQIFRSPRRSLTAPFPISVPPPSIPATASLHSSNDSGFCNDQANNNNNNNQASPTPPAPVESVTPVAEVPPNDKESKLVCVFVYI